MRYKQEIDINWFPEELDEFLQKEYSYSLWHFSLSLAMNFIFWGDPRSTHKAQLLRKRKNDFLKELRNIKKISNENFPYIAGWAINKKIKERTQRGNTAKHATQTAIQEYQSERLKFLRDLDSMIKNHDIELNDQNLRGSPRKRINVLILIWSHFIKDKNQIHTANIISLLEWFNEQSRNHKQFVSCFKEIKKIKNENIKRLIQRYKRQNSLDETIKEGKLSFKVLVGNKIISFEDNKTMIKNFEKHEWYIPPLITFPSGEKLTIEDFKENSKSAKASYKNRIHPSL